MTSPTTAPITQLLADLEATTTAVQNNDWVTAGLYGATAAADVLGAGPDPLSALTTAGFGWMTDFVSFLTAPLETLLGEPGAVSSSSGSLQSTGQNVSELAGSYQQSSGTETPNWSGTAASGYQNTSGELADELRAIGKASAGVSSAMAGASDVIGKAQQIITQLVGEAAGKITPIMTQAMATAPATGGASVAAAVPQCVAIAVQYGQQIAEKMGALLSSSQNLAKLVLAMLKSLQVIDKAITKTTKNSAAAR
ncbi:hypothetical protein [Amycolatopsis nigrescens]|uniref:hypothetical protein n=1 Tax=Amycolatopsis nigrescens TaxID=381445 RepID=UPI00039B5C5F|nr:hypothetical protein [Amycolatopsis nigrescens]